MELIFQRHVQGYVNSNMIPFYVSYSHVYQKEHLNFDGVDSYTNK